MSTSENIKRIPISLTTEDFHLLYRVQEGYLFSGNSREGMWQLSDILKAVVIDAWIDCYRRFPTFGSIKLSQFILNHHGAQYPFPEEKKYESIINSYFKSIGKQSPLLRGMGLMQRASEKYGYLSAESPGADEKISYFMQGEKSIPNDHSTSNFILKLNENELDVFDDVKYYIQAFLNTTISYSEMVRTLFRELLNCNGEMAERNKLNFLSSIYMGSLYQYSPQNSILIFSEMKAVRNLQLDPGTLAWLKWAGRDGSIMDSYIREIVKLKNPSYLVENITPAEDRGYIIDLSNTLRNLRLEKTYRSSVSLFNFHSAFIGLLLLVLEWKFNQHNPSILATYLNAVIDFQDYKDNVKKFFGVEVATNVFGSFFIVQMEKLYRISAQLQRNGSLRLD